VFIVYGERCGGTSTCTGVNNYIFGAKTPTAQRQYYLASRKKNQGLGLFEVFGFLGLRA
jgi:hypothetical protein